MYARDAAVTDVMLWIRTFPDLVALGSSSSTELGEVKTCLYAYVNIYEIRTACSVSLTYRYE